MELLTETVLFERELSTYELERHKPIPTLIHGAIQANLTIQIAITYPNQFRIASEVTLDTLPAGSTPDLVLYPAGELDFKNNPASPFSYTFFHDTEIVKDSTLNIEINLTEIFK
jgi:hypothetical protein